MGSEVLYLHADDVPREVARISGENCTGLVRRNAPRDKLRYPIFLIANAGFRTKAAPVGADEATSRSRFGPNSFGKADHAASTILVNRVLTCPSLTQFFLGHRLATSKCHRLV